MSAPSRGGAARPTSQRLTPTARSTPGPSSTATAPAAGPRSTTPTGGTKKATTGGSSRATTPSALSRVSSAEAPRLSLGDTALEGGVQQLMSPSVASVGDGSDSVKSSRSSAHKESTCNVKVCCRFRPLNAKEVTSDKGLWYGSGCVVSCRCEARGRAGACSVLCAGCVQLLSCS